MCCNKAGLSIAILSIKVRAVMCINLAGVVTIPCFVGDLLFVCFFSPPSHFYSGWGGLIGRGGGCPGGGGGYQAVELRYIVL